MSDKATDAGIPVLSTDGFPDQGRLSVRGTVIAYTSKTPTSFEGLTIGLYDKPKRAKNLGSSRIVTSFDARCIPEKTRESMEQPQKFAASKFKDKDSPLMWQNRTESIFFDQDRECSHWWYDRGMPVKFIGRGDRGANVTPRGAGTYEKQGNNWVKTGDLDK